MFSADISQIQREEKADKEFNTTVVSQNDGANARPVNADRANKLSRSRSRRRRITDAGQTDYVSMPEVDEDTPAAELGHRSNPQTLKGQVNGHPTDPISTAPPVILSNPPDENLENAKAIPLPASPGERPSAGPGQAFPFKLGRDTADPGPEGTNASTITLTTEAGVVPLPPKDDDSGAAQTGAPTIPDDDDDDDDEQLHPVVHNAQDETDPPHHHHHQSSPIEPVEDAHGDHHHHADDDDGVDHYDLRNNNNNNPPLPLKGGENGAELADNNAVGPADGKRRSTLVDAKGVLYHGPGIVGGLGRTKRKEDDDYDNDGGVMRRPGIDRSDTASLD